MGLVRVMRSPSAGQVRIFRSKNKNEMRGFFAPLRMTEICGEGIQRGS
jgi:hypothetical protein